MADPIPAAKFAQFDAAMRAADNDDLSDGAWFAVLEETAKHFMRVNRIKGCCNDATHQWLNNLRAAQAEGGGNG